jgi:hypothetical protein
MNLIQYGMPISLNGKVILSVTVYDGIAGVKLLNSIRAGI